MAEHLSTKEHTELDGQLPLFEQRTVRREHTFITEGGFDYECITWKETDPDDTAGHYY